MRIGELAEQAGLSRDAVRFYERTGLLTARRLPNGYRDFPPEAVPWLRYVRTAQALGFTLAEIARTGAELDGAPDAAERLPELPRRKIALIDARTALRADLVGRVGTGCPPAPLGGTTAQKRAEVYSSVHE
ncbi:MerR family transcriptional regulator [Kitasatospora sp. NPDC004614]|uniref:MerR family transcriptional regulator n=1 Tax=unclassified Kitasatospora TaxID=2633591 RepID=UPI0036D02AAB